MTTIVSPASSPVPVYNRSGTTIAGVAGGAVSGASPVGNDGTPIPRVSGETIAIVGALPTGSSDGVVVLPDDAEVGDKVEVYSAALGSGKVFVFPPVGGSIAALPASTGTDSASYVVVSSHPNQSGGSGAIFRLVSATQWQVIVGS